MNRLTLIAILQGDGKASDHRLTLTHATTQHAIHHTVLEVEHAEFCTNSSCRGNDALLDFG